MATVSLGVYIWKRLASLGVEHVFGVPGDFNLTLLDEIYHVPELKWLGCCNELNAAYAVDGYARIKGNPGALLTTYGVGELSAMNGVAGAMAEHAGMIHLVGMTARGLQKQRALIHHTMYPNMDHQIYVGMSEPIRKTHTVLMDEAVMAEEIDRVMIEGVKSRLPVYIYIPTDVVSVQLDAARLESPLDTTIRNDDIQAEDEIVHKVLELIKTASNPIILGDVLAIRHGGQALTRKLADLTNFQTFSTPLSKGIFDETHENYGGLYNGTVSFPGIADAVHGSDLVLNIGPLLSDSNTGGWTRSIADSHLVFLGHDHCQIQSAHFKNVHFLPILTRIVSTLENNPKAYNLPRTNRPRIDPPILSNATSGNIKQDYIWQRIGRFLREGDIILAESGTAQFGMPDATFPQDAKWITQIFWSSIGYTVGASLGACVAAKELQRNGNGEKSNASGGKGRVILIVGEGSLQMTVQEIGTLIRFGFTPIIFVINNSGYSIERAINGPEQEYNDVSDLWDYQGMLKFFGARQERSFRCETVEELEVVLGEKQFSKAEVIQVCEVVMGKFDYPWRLNEQLVIARARMKAMKETNRSA